MGSTVTPSPFSLLSILAMKKIAFWIQHMCAVILIVTSIILAFYQVIHIRDISGGVLMYIAQAFLLAGSIFGLDYYVQKLTKIINDSKGTEKQ